MYLYPPLRREHALAFGRVIAAWAYLETVLNYALENCFNLPMEWQGYLYIHLDYVQKRDLFRATIANIDREAFEERLREIERLNKIRKLVAHTFWTEGRKQGSIKPYGAKGRGNVKFLGLEDNEKEWTSGELNKEAASMMNEAKRLEKLLARHGFDFE